ncbi:hypothetical protein CsSME_00018668 [Camellia sinensis var. sinensis]
MARKYKFLSPLDLFPLHLSNSLYHLQQIARNQHSHLSLSLASSFSPLYIFTLASLTYLLKEYERRRDGGRTTNHNGGRTGAYDSESEGLGFAFIPVIKNELCYNRYKTE